MKIAVVLGTRPEIIKMAPIIRELSKSKIDFFITHTNQHYSVEMDKIFFDELLLSKAKYNLDIGSGTHGEQTGRMLAGLEKVFIKEKPDYVLVHGDTNTTLAGALAARKLLIKVGHVEAGLRSYDMTMPEEVNRILVDDISNDLFAPTIEANNNLISEGKKRESIHIVGNTIVDAVSSNLKIAMKKGSDFFNKLKIQNFQYIVLTIHRAENTNDIKRLKSIFESLNKIPNGCGVPIVFPIHPRTKNILNQNKIKLDKNIIVIEPIGYLDMLVLISKAKLVITDSGGLQEEACILKVPCVTLRENTERPETLDVGSNILGGISEKTIIPAINKMISKKNDWKNPFGSGDTAQQIIKIVKQKI